MLGAFTTSSLQHLTVVGDLMLQPWDTMSLITADLGSVWVRARSSELTQASQQGHSSTRASAWRANRDPKAKMLSLQSFLRKGVSWGCVGRIKT